LHATDGHDVTEEMRGGRISRNTQMGCVKSQVKSHENTKIKSKKEKREKETDETVKKKEMA
jgi:hypothetical protein